MIDLSKIEIIETGNWQNPPPITLMSELDGFFKMFESCSDKKLLKWFIQSPIQHRTIQVNKGHYIGFFVHGKLFGHFMRDFDSISDYIEATERDIYEPKKLEKDRTARSHGWPSIDTAVHVWRFISGSLSSNNYFERERKEKFSQIVRNKKEPDYKLLPPYDSDCHSQIDWLLWSYAHAKGWKSFKDFLTYAEQAMPKYKQKYLKEEKQRAFLSFLVYHGPFKERDEWLQGWPDFDSLLRFWDMGVDKNRLMKAIWTDKGTRSKSLIAETAHFRRFPGLLKFDPTCLVGFDWVLWTKASQNGWSSFKELQKAVKEKDPKISEHVTDKLLYEFAIRTPAEVREIEVLTEQQKRMLFFKTKEGLSEIKYG